MPTPFVDGFAINADDVPRARKFYEAAFGWKFEPWGPPNFYLIPIGKGPMGMLQERRELVKGKPTVAYECTITVDNIDETIKAIEAAGGKMAAPKYHIPTVGTVAYYYDTEGNVFGLMQLEPTNPRKNQ